MKVQAGIPALPASAPADSTKWATYCNHLHGYCIDYDPLLLDARPEADAGDGRIFLDRQGNEFLRVYWRLNNDPDLGISSPDAEMEKAYQEFTAHSGDKGGRTTVYKSRGKDFAVFSGAKNGEIYYTRIYATSDGLVFAEFRYAEKDKARYDKMVTHMAASLVQTNKYGDPH